MVNIGDGNLVRCGRESCKDKLPEVRRLQRLVIRKPIVGDMVHRAEEGRWIYYCTHCNNILTEMDGVEVVNLPDGWK